MTAPTDLLQQDHTTRKAIVHDTNRTCFVEAGAGSGKTTQLVARLLTLLIEEGVSIDKLAAITFNTAAAAELTARLRRDLDNIAYNGYLRFDNPKEKYKERHFEGVSAEDVSARATRALEGLPGAAFETLHAFSLRILKQYPLQAGLPPHVDKVDELQASFNIISRQEDALELFSRLLDGDETAAAEIDALGCGVDSTQLTEALQTLMDFDTKLKNITELTSWMDEHWGELPTPEESPLFEGEGLTEAAMRRVIIEARDLADGFPDMQKKWLAPRLATIEDHLGAGLPPETWTLGKGFGRATGETKSKEARHAIGALLQQLEAKKLDPAVAALTVVRKVLIAVVLRNAASRCRSGRLEYHDMVYKAQELLTDPSNGDIRQQLNDHYRAIFVDEFQDTAPAQLDIVRAIAGGASGDPAPGRLFMVGDPKQSIYRFRNADVDTYMQAKAGAEEVMVMSRNFRSAPAVIDAVNTLFSSIFATSAEEIAEGEGLRPAQIDYSTMIAKEALPGEQGRVVFLRDGEHLDDRDDHTAPDALEAADIVALIRSALSDGAMEFYRTPTQFSLQDIAVIVPTHQAGRRILAALRASGIPCISEGSSLAFASPEIDDLLTVLRAIADPADGLARVNALRSFIYSCSDAELAEYAAWENQARDTGVELSTLVPAAHPVAVAQDSLTDEVFQSHNAPLGEYLRAFVERFHVTEAVAASGQPSDLARLETILLHAEAFAHATGLGLRPFLTWADAQATDSQGLADPILDDGRDAVRIMTVHAAKGREFPFTILGGLGNLYGNLRDKQGVDRETGSLEFTLDSGIQTPGWDTVMDYLRAADITERVRVHYVAATRAKNVLALPLEIRPNKNGTTPKKARGAVFVDEIRAAATADKDALSFMHRDELPHGAELAPTAQDVDIANVLNALQEQLHKETAALKEAAQIAPRVAVTRVAHATESSELTTEDNDATAGPNEATVATGARVRSALGAASVGGQSTRIIGNTELVGGTAFGSAVHEVMELLPDTAGDRSAIAELSATIAPLHEVDTDAVKDIVAAAASFAHSAPYLTSLRAKTCYRELAVVDEVAGVAVDGVIDVLYLDPELDQPTWVVADYKTDKSATPETISAYFTQLELYARVAEKALGQPVGRLELIFTTRDEGPGQVVTQHRLS